MCGVSQGSTLGPLLFSFYVNDLPQLIKFHVNLLADDTVLILKNKIHFNLQALADHELSIINDRMKYNYLTLNYKKTPTLFLIPNKREFHYKIFPFMLVDVNFHMQIV